ncbi:unnamed protein product [Orchesella dallaii]|uniref:Protein kinase domain-containing protein n=1 Tax=Orchesella dallaii TaxID=48710 RepID=A0ABP1PJS1_9HEXA
MFLPDTSRLLLIGTFMVLLIKIGNTEIVKKSPKIFVDISGAIEMLMNDEIQLDELKRSFLKYGNFSQTKDQPLFSIFYSINSKRLKNLNQLTTLTVFLSSVFPPNSSIDLILSAPYENGILEEQINGTRENLLQMAEINLKIAIRFEGLCDEKFVKGITSLINSIKSAKSAYSISSTVSNLEIGLELKNSQLENCQNILNITKFVLKTGTLEAFVESYGLFERTLDRFHEKTVSILNMYSNPIPLILYRFKYNQFFSFCQLLQFLEFWISKADMTYVSGIVFPFPYQNETNFIENECLAQIPPAIVIPTILEYDDSNNEEKIKWYQPDVSQALNSKFAGVFLNYGDWDKFNREISTKPITNTGNLPNIILDFSLENVNSLNWSDISNHLLESKANTKLTSLAYPVLGAEDISKETENKLSAIGNQEKFQVGCIFQSVLTVIPRHFQQAIDNCLKINGNFSIFTINLDSAEVLHTEFSYSHYLYRTLPSLNKLKEIREELRRHYFDPNFKLYIRIVTRSSPETDKKYTATVFCNAEILSRNEYFEGILNWARRNDFPIILKSAFDSIEKPDVSSWLSVLRPVTSIYSFSNGFPQLRSSHPIFVMRNHPKNINGWNTSPCIPWLPLNPEENADFLSNTHAGSILTMGLKQDNSISIQELQTMFHFVVHKFSIVEILLHRASHVYAVGDAFSSKYVQTLLQSNISHHPKFFMDYNMEAGDIRPDRLPSIYQKFREFQRNTLISAEGVHVHYSEVLKSEREGRSYSVAKMLSGSSTIGKLKVGLVMPGICMDDLQLAQRNGTSTIRKVLKKMHYIVCKEVISVETSDGMEDMGTLFDTHLYIKRTIERDYPGLGLYFKLQLDIELSKNKENMARYKRFVKHCQLFGAAYDIQYFMVEVFDSENTNGRRSNGWWSIADYSDLTNVHVYTEKEAAYSGRDTWRPPKSGYKKSDTDSSSYEMSGTFFIGLLLGLTIFLILLLIGSICLVIRYRKLRATNTFLTAKEVMEFRNGIVSAEQRPVDTIPVDNLRFIDDYELPYSDIHIDCQVILGTGQFGIVYKGTVRERLAAIKIPTGNCGKETFKNILSEVRVLCHLGNHQHIVSFLGAYVQEIRKGKLYIATELCENGSLEKYLRNRTQNLLPDGSRYINLNEEASRMILPSELIRFSLEIARGMEYIASKNVVHGDLAARNVLLDSKLVCKIGDFGLSRKVYEYQKYTKTSQEPLPWKWMAYESLTQMEFTSMSDVWSYGVTVWEIFSLGHMPFAGLHWSATFANELRNGLRLPAPQLAPQLIYEKLLNCWELDSQKRPAFTELADFFQNMDESTYQNTK